jgi:hypothetical protein
MKEESHRRDRQADRAIRRFLRVFRFRRPPRARPAETEVEPMDVLEERRRQVLLREESRARAMLMLHHW